MSTWQTILTGLCACLAAFLVWKEAQRPNRARLALRVAASLIAVAAFVCLVLPIMRKAPVSATGTRPAILLTQGFSPEPVMNFLRQQGDSLPVYILDPALEEAARRFHPQLVSETDWPLIGAHTTSIHLFGEGLDEDALARLPAGRCIFHPAPLAGGISAAQWPTRLKAGEPLTVQGSYSNPSPTAVKVILSAYDTDLDTAFVAPHSHGMFSVSATPRQLGKAVYGLRALSGTTLLEKEPLPFEVEPPGTLRVFMLSASPDFETKFLKGWLSQNSYALVTRTTISKDKYEKTFTNTPRILFSTITPAFLGNFDVMIADQRALAALGAAEAGAIEAQVSRRGMGLIVRADSTGQDRPFYARPFPLVPDPGQNEKTLSLLIPAGNPAGTALNVEHPAYIRAVPGTQPLITDKGSNTVVSNSLYGAGKLVYSTITSTATWMLSGNTAAYGSYWSCLLGKASARTEVAAAWSIGPDFPVVNKPVAIRYASNNPDAPAVQIGQNRINLSQDPALPFQWQGTFWPDRKGWQAAMSGSQTFWWYAYGPEDWKTAAALHRTTITRQALEATGHEYTKAETGNSMAEVPVSKSLFLVPFFMSLAFLWLEKKL